MNAPNKVEIFNKMTNRYGVVPLFIFEHPVYGANMVLASEVTEAEPEEAPAEKEEPKPSPKPAPGAAKDKPKSEGE